MEHIQLKLETLRVKGNNADSLWREKNCPLEILPPEVRHCILSLLPLAELQSTIRASPVFLLQFKLARKSLIWNFLRKKFGKYMVDVCAVQIAGSADFAKTRSKQQVIECLATYKDRRGDTNYDIMYGKLTEKDVVEIAVFHTSVVQPLVSIFTGRAWAELAQQGVQRTQIDKQLSRTEEIRIWRAFYRFQLACNLFGRNDTGFSNTRSDFDHIYIFDEFLRTFEYWEIEEIVCVHGFAKNKFENAFKAIRDDNQDLLPPNCELVLSINSDYHLECLVEGTISRGLCLLKFVLLSIKSHKHLIETMEKNAASSPFGFLEDAWGATTQDLAMYGDGGQKKSWPRFLRFQGDFDPVSHSDEWYPPWGWVLSCAGFFSRSIGCYKSLASQTWGYVFWDVWRIEETGTREVLIQEEIDESSTDDRITRLKELRPPLNL